jgi:hypothetical protein
MVQDVEEVIAEVDRWDRGAFQEVRWWVLAWPVGALAVAAAAGARAWRSLRPVDAASAWRWARQEAERRVGGAPAGLPDVEAARWLGSRWPDAASILEELAWESHRARFGSGDLGAWRGLVTRLRDRLARTPE